MKKNNPNTPILLREAQGTLPKVFARYDLGRETSKSLDGKNLICRARNGNQSRLIYRPGLSDKQIEDVVSGLVKSEV